MATIMFNQDADANTAFLNIPNEIDVVNRATSTVFEIGDPRFTLLRLDGVDFTYSSPNVPSAGTLTGFSLIQNGVVVATVTDLAPLLTLTQAESLRLGGNPGALLRYLLASNDVAAGGAGDQVIMAEGGDDTLDGGAGADYIAAGDGNDVVISRRGQGPNGAGSEILIGGDGIDYLMIDRGDLSLAFTFDLMAVEPTTMLDGTRLSGFEQLEFYAGSGSDVIAGGNLHDIISGGAGSDRINGRGDDDILSGGEGADYLDGGSSNDIITGDDGADVIDGGLGNDTIDGGLQADNIFGAEGNDILRGGAGADNIDGGADDDLIVGGDGIDILEGSSGNDTIEGGMQADNLFGGDGTDLLDGGPGTDYLEGGSGDDIYYVDNPSDVLFDADGQGFDTVVAIISYSLTAAASIEHMRAADPFGRAPIDLRGNGFANFIEGNAGANAIYGLGGSDTLKGGRGRDTFVFNTEPKKDNVDRILDFNVKDDSFRLSRSIFKELSGRKILDNEAFYAGRKAADEDDRVIYNPSTGSLYYDRDGAGSSKPILLAKLAKRLKITEADFLF